jgi:hypothetical protein
MAISGCFHRRLPGHWWTSGSVRLLSVRGYSNGVREEHLTILALKFQRYDDVTSPNEGLVFDRQQMYSSPDIPEYEPPTRGPNAGVGTPYPVEMPQLHLIDADVHSRFCARQPTAPPRPATQHGEDADSDSQAGPRRWASNDAS